VILESLIQWFLTADYRRYETPWASASIRVGPLFVPTLELLACLTAATLAVATWAWLRFTYVGKALRAAAEDPAMAGAFGVNTAPTPSCSPASARPTPAWRARSSR